MTKQYYVSAALAPLAKNSQKLFSKQVRSEKLFGDFLSDTQLVYGLVLHAKAILNNPSTYEILNPADFGLSRYVHFASRFTGWNAIKSRCEQLGMQMTDAQYKECTAKI